MDTLGWFFMLAGVYLVWSGVTGRLFDVNGKLVLGANIEKMITGILTGKLPSLEGDTGVTNPVEIGQTSEGNYEGGSENSGIGGNGSTATGIELLNAARKRGSAAKGYRWAATGPTYYDCSGLVWRAVQDIRPSLRKLPRFTTYTMRIAPWGKYFEKLPDSAARTGDIVLWKAHVGIVSGPDMFYSARNPHSGIGVSRIGGFHGSEKPVYLRLTGGNIGV